MELIRIPNRPPHWDELIRRYDTKVLFHESAWHDHLLTIHRGGRIEYFELADQGRTVGYFCAFAVRKFLLSIYGSPLPGTGTNYMGPIVNRELDLGKFLEALVRMCKRNRVAHLELSHDWLEPVVMTNLGFAMHPNVTHVAPLPESEAAGWALLRSECRNRIRKAEKNGLRAELTSDPSIVDHYYDQFTEVYAKQGMVPPWSRERPRSLFECLLPAGRILPVWVKHRDTVVATGLFPFDERCVFFWGAASWLKYQDLCPNELLHWTVMRLAIARQISLYNMCGGTSQFKNKFGGSDVPYVHYSRSFFPLLEAGRRGYEYLHRKKLRVLGLLRRSGVGLKAGMG